MNSWVKYGLFFLFWIWSISVEAKSEQITSVPESEKQEQIFSTFAITFEGLHQTFDFQFFGKTFSNTSSLSFFYFSENEEVEINKTFLKLDFFANFKNVFSTFWYFFHTFD